MEVLKFNAIRGMNVVLEKDGIVAHRVRGCQNGVVFSEKPLMPGEIFSIEVERTVLNFNGTLRLGVSQVSPSLFENSGTPVASCAVPELMKHGPTWVYSVLDLMNSPAHRLDPIIQSDSWPHISSSNEYVQMTLEEIVTCRGRYSRDRMRNEGPLPIQPPNVYPISVPVGWRFGVLYAPVNSEVADIYFVSDGYLSGPYAVEIPYANGPVYAVVDLYGEAKKVRRLQTQAFSSLKKAARSKLYEYGRNGSFEYLPGSIKQYLEYKPEEISEDRSH